jgi:hypothetical protein
MRSLRVAIDNGYGHLDVGPATASDVWGLLSPAVLLEVLDGAQLARPWLLIRGNGNRVRLDARGDKTRAYREVARVFPAGTLATGPTWGVEVLGVPALESFGTPEEAMAFGDLGLETAGWALLTTIGGAE